MLLAMHSFTPQLLAKPAPRPWHVGLCFGTDARFSLQVLAVLEKQTDILVGCNEPYSVDITKDYSIPIHAEARGIPYVEFEIRQDLIGLPSGQKAWANRLDGVIREAYAGFMSSQP